VHQSGTYHRIDSGNNDAGTVSNQSPGLPIPSMAAGFDLGDKGELAAAFYAPYAGLMKFDPTGPQRYSLVDLSKSVLATASIGVGWKLGDRVRVGATFQDWISLLDQQMVVSGCPGQTVCAPEDPDFDALVQIEQTDLWNPSGSVGVQIDAGDKVTIGATAQAPVLMQGSATIRTRLPSNNFYAGATVQGDKGQVKFWLPAVGRLGVEVHPNPRWHVEVAGEMEYWKLHKDMTVTPENIYIENAPGVGEYQLGPMSVPRDYQNTYAGSIGLEGQPSKSMPLRVMAGYTYETAAAPDKYLSVLTFDGAKHLITGGLGYTFGKLTIDSVVAYGKVATRTVSPSVGQSPQLDPVRDPNDPPLSVYVNWGTYKTSWLVAGASVRTEF
jgi:long-chain fatty acid transport protein